jgi:hypothetical protein
VLLKVRDDYAGAEALYRRALAIFERVLGPDHPHTVICRENLALLRSQIEGDNEECEAGGADSRSSMSGSAGDCGGPRSADEFGCSSWPHEPAR